MKKIPNKRALLVTLAAFVIGNLTGCEWESPDEDSYWAERYSWVDFSGVYKNPRGGTVVTDFTDVAPIHITDEGEPIVSLGPVTIAQGNGGNSYSGTLMPNVVPGSVQITAGGVTFTDNGFGGLIPSSGLDTMNGSIRYSSGAWSIFLGGVTVPNGEPITARYSIYRDSSSSDSPNRNPKKGTTKTSIYSLVVFHENNNLRIVDSDGMQYLGKLGSLRSSAGELGDLPKLGDIIIAQFSAKGVSKAGLEVELTGTFQGTIKIGGKWDYIMYFRTIQGSWIEKNGKVGNIQGHASDVLLQIGVSVDTEGRTNIVASSFVP